MEQDKKMRDEQNEYGVSPAGNREQGQRPQDAPDEKDALIKNEPNTKRLRSERQSVIDGEQNKDNE